MSYDLTPYSRWQVILAEDDTMFQMLFTQAMTQGSFPEERVRVADDGQEAIDALDAIEKEAPDAPVIMFLDVMMPGMDGHGCAKHIKKDVQEKRRARSPFMVCCSANNSRVITDPKECEDFHMIIPKQFNGTTLLNAFANAEASLGSPSSRPPPSQGGGYSDGRRPEAAVAARPASAAKRDPNALMDIIVADDEPICALACISNLALLGVSEDQIIESDSKEELLEKLDEAQGGEDRPLLVCLRTCDWARAVKEQRFEKRKPFIVNTSGDSEDDPYSNAKILSDMSSGLSGVLKQCRTWWLNGSK
eukprot:TRINITY_DN5163_c0_g1_i1.p1 TRINITY_DN5163_c0_g1~~TRINITY_DN5163_c0_g1_i1.p1  ORF type:complete len:305 (+),score=47.08 TRINITY_DN5163_c0_g1_i1:112-1026(+)